MALPGRRRLLRAFLARMVQMGPTLLDRLLLVGWVAALTATPARASFLSGEALDTFADILALVVLFVVPVVVIVLFWIVHVLPEKIAEKRHHPQTAAITTLCLLSLVFGGLLWPIAWLWAYTKPVLYKAAYGTDQVAHGHDDTSHPSPDKHKDEAKELDQLRKRLAELESKQAGKPAPNGGKA